MQTEDKFVCFLCGKQIDVQNYEVHVSFCTGKGTKKLLFDPSKMDIPGPRAIQCYICGKAFFKRSIDIHIKSCKKAWENNEAQKPAKDRRTVPKPPKGYEEMKENLDKPRPKPMAMPKAPDGPLYDPYEDEEFLAESLKSWASKSLVPCKMCGRKFIPTSLKVHERSCTGPDTFKPKKSETKK